MLDETQRSEVLMELGFNYHIFPLFLMGRTHPSRSTCVCACAGASNSNIRENFVSKLLKNKFFFLILKVGSIRLTKIFNSTAIQILVTMYYMHQ